MTHYIETNDYDGSAVSIDFKTWPKITGVIIKMNDELIYVYDKVDSLKYYMFPIEQITRLSMWYYDKSPRDKLRLKLENLMPNLSSLV